MLHSDQFPFIYSFLEDGTVDVAIQSETNDARATLSQQERHKNQVIVDQLGTAAIIELIQTSDESTDAQVKMIELDSLAPNPEIQTVVGAYQQRLENQFSRSVQPKKQQPLPKKANLQLNKHLQRQSR